MPLDTEIVKAEIARFYLESRDFNGIPFGELLRRTDSSAEQLTGVLQELIRNEIVGLLGLEGGNSHIVLLGFSDVDTQIGSLACADANHTCLYLRRPYLNEYVPPDLYATLPYKRAMALGEPQLSFRSFDLHVLEDYRNDPRYRYRNFDLSGDICIRDEFFECEQVAEADKILLSTFGFSFDQDMNRAVAVFLRYLADLSAEHQRMWHARELNGEYALHPDYFESKIMGSWDTGVSACDAILAEMRLINKMAAAMGREPLFTESFGEYGERKPAEFAFLLRPTNHEYQSFILVLDRMLSDNLNRRFFANDVPYEREIVQADGRIRVEQKGTLAILDEWLRAHFEVENWNPWDTAIATLREVRRLRQGPAHRLDDNHFDTSIFTQQQALLERVYSAVRALRILLSHDEMVLSADIAIDRFLVTGDKIRFQ
ncbi:AAA family ATPase [Lacipirellula parvula]|uniref:Uncharacterized protein n=1 Tax=Lacipirellula parvula TaxID=2650471 RepID=A0A5K7X9H4_9BACT|nr:AAA family ATPase [Lacipirellula parvula]BBO32537.1 hypothetical protein PLANPX_2149 [Lacipirellula parvula]